MQKSAAFDGLNALVQNIVIKESDNDNNNVSSAKSIPWSYAFLVTVSNKMTVI